MATLRVSALLLGATMVAGSAAAQTADVQIIHNSPDPAAAVVDIWLDGAPAIQDVPFRAATGVVALPADTDIEIGIAPGDSDDPSDILATFPVTLSSAESYIVMASGVISGGLPDNPEGISTAFSLFPTTGLRTSSGSGTMVDIIAYHGAPDAPTVDVIAQGVGELFGDLAYTDYAADYVSVPADSYTLWVTPGDMPEGPVATFTADLSGLGGGAAVVFASGYLAGSPEAFGLFAALSDGTVVELPAASTPTVGTSWSGMKEIFGR